MSGVYFLFLKAIPLLLPFETLHHSVYFVFNFLLQLHISNAFMNRSSFFPSSMFLIHKEQHSKYNFYKLLFYFQTKFILSSQHVKCSTQLSKNTYSSSGTAVRF